MIIAFIAHNIAFAKSLFVTATFKEINNTCISENTNTNVTNPNIISCRSIYLTKYYINPYQSLYKKVVLNKGELYQLLRLLPYISPQPGGKQSVGKVHMQGI